MTILAVPVFYCDPMVGDTSSFSPSAGKPKPVVESWQALGVQMSVTDVTPVTNETLCLAHSPEYVKRIFAGQELNGFKNKRIDLAETCRYTVSAMIEAGREALRNGEVAVAPVAGFHHARYSKAAGFCTFNGLIIAAQKLKLEGLVQKIGIIDCDVHYGDGTASLIELLELGGWISHYTLGEQLYTTPERVEELFAHLPKVIEDMADCDLIIYQAGADPHINDPLGGVMTAEQMLRRDELVFSKCLAMGLPVAWNLAGGYQRDDSHGIRPVLDLHDNTMLACVRTYVG
jgi:acetoin utilization deacetylase AcuC-like enzyme